MLVIPEPSQRDRPEVAGPMTGFARSPESITIALSDYALVERHPLLLWLWIPGSRAFARAPE